MQDVKFYGEERVGVVIIQVSFLVTSSNCTGACAQIESASGMFCTCGIKNALSY